METANPMQFVTVAHLVKDYADGPRQHTVLKGVSFTLKQGEIVALMGASGSANPRCSICSAAWTAPHRVKFRSAAPN